MKPVIGIPRGLFFYKYYPLWQGFFDSLNVETKVSQKTNKQIMNDGVNNCVDEACLPVKIFMGHVLDLKDSVDVLFIPRYTSVSKKEYICPKFGGLPDMVRSSIKNLPPIIDAEINMRKDKDNSAVAAIKIGQSLGFDFFKSAKAYEKAVEFYRDFRSKVQQYKFPHRLINQEKVISFNEKKLKILLLGHVYNVCDSYANMNIINKLESHNCEVISLEMFDSRVLRTNVEQLQKQFFWQYGSYTIGCIYEVLKSNKIDGIIYLSSFGCGIDSFVAYMAERRVRDLSSIPYTTIILDEHSGEAGLNTRLDAFIDTLLWRCNNEVNVSTHG